MFATALFLSACGGGDDPATTGVASATDLDEAAISAEELASDAVEEAEATGDVTCLLYTSPSPRDRQKSRMPSSA